MIESAITFSNGEKIIIQEDQLLVPYRIYSADDGEIISMSPPHKIWNHMHDGLIPSITEFMCTCEYFRPLEEVNKIYKTSAIVSIENL